MRSAPPSRQNAHARAGPRFLAAAARHRWLDKGEGNPIACPISPAASRVALGDPALADRSIDFAHKGIFFGQIMDPPDELLRPNPVSVRRPGAGSSKRELLRPGARAPPPRDKRKSGRTTEIAREDRRPRAWRRFNGPSRGCNLMRSIGTCCAPHGLPAQVVMPPRRCRRPKAAAWRRQMPARLTRQWTGSPPLRPGGQCLMLIRGARLLL